MPEAGEDDLKLEDRIKYTVEAWKMTVGVQEHFNRIEMQIRGLAITILTTVASAAAVAYKDNLPDVARLLLLAGAGAWLSFYFMDRFWYHEFLRAAGGNAEEIEEEIDKLGLVGFKLNDKIRTSSRLEITDKIVIRSGVKITIFYFFVIGMLVLAFLASYR